MDKLRKNGGIMAYALGIPLYICETPSGLVLCQNPPVGARLIETIEPSSGSNPAVGERL